MWRENSPTDENCCARENAKNRDSSRHLDRRRGFVRLPRQLVARVMNGQVGVESSGVLWAGESGGSGLAPGEHHSGSSALAF